MDFKHLTDSATISHQAWPAVQLAGRKLNRLVVLWIIAKADTETHTYTHAHTNQTNVNS